jgi:hypothetical protein
MLDCIDVLFARSYFCQKIDRSGKPVVTILEKLILLFYSEVDIGHRKDTSGYFSLPVLLFYCQGGFVCHLAFFNSLHYAFWFENFKMERFSC